jgi:hypothetical protein
MPYWQQQGGNVEIVNKLDCRKIPEDLLKQFIG